MQLTLPIGVLVKMEVLLLCQRPGEGEGLVTMHVQSLSHWAPANIGPYSQAVRVSGIHLASLSSIRECGKTCQQVVHIVVCLRYDNECSMASGDFSDVVTLSWEMVSQWLHES